MLHREERKPFQRVQFRCVVLYKNMVGHLLEPTWGFTL